MHEPATYEKPEAREPDRDESPSPHHLKPYHKTGAGLPNAENLRPMTGLNTQEIPPVVKQYQTPGPGPSSGIPQRDLELSKVDVAVENVRAILARGGPNEAASLQNADIRFELSKIEKAIKYLKEH